MVELEKKGVRQVIEHIPSIEHNGAGAAASTQPNVPLRGSVKSRVRRPFSMRLFSFLNGVTIFVAFLVAIAELMSLVYIKSLSIPAIVIRVYALFFCFMVMLSELEWFRSVRESVFVTSWIVRGVSYVFVGTLVYETRPETQTSTQNVTYIKVTSLALVVLGLLYFGMGFLFIKRYRDSQLAKYRTMLAHAEMSDALRQDSGASQI